METNLKDKLITFWVTKDEKKMMDDHIQSLGYRNRSEFLRQVIFDVNIINTDLEPIKNLGKEINAVGINVNQIARKVNQENNIDEKDIVQILKKQEEIEKLVVKFIDGFLKK